jgi:hypothetical protein
MNDSGNEASANGKQGKLEMMSGAGGSSSQSDHEDYDKVFEKT